MTVTDEVLAELQRCAEKLKAYKATYFQKQPAGAAHAAASRASLDLSKSLAKWRRTFTEYKQPK